MTLATSYAFGDVFGVSHSLHRGLRDAKVFYASFSAMVALAAGVVLIPGAPLGLITTSVQALAGVLLPSASVFLVLLCNDRAVLGPWVNPTWLNILASAIVGVLVELSLILVMTTIFPSLNAGAAFLYMSIALVICLSLAGLYIAWRREPAGEAKPIEKEKRATWTMPPLALLEPAKWSPGRKTAMLAMRTYLVIAVALLIVKATQLGH